MSLLRRLAAALTPEADEHEARAHAVAASLKVLRGDVQTIRREAAAAAARAEALSRQVARVRRLQEGSRDLPAVLDDLAARLTSGRVAAHVRAAIERAPLDSESTRLAVEGCWPDDVYDVLTAAIPDSVFFDDTPSGALTLRMPPRLAPTAAIAIWTFVSGIVEEVVVPAVAARFGDRIAGGVLDIVPARLVSCPAGASAPPPAAKAWHRGAIVIDLSGANTAVAVSTPSGPYVPPAPERGVRHTYEVWFGSKPA